MESEESRKKARENMALEKNIEIMPEITIKDKIGKEPLKLIYQNIGLITENSKAKKDYFEEYIKENNVIIINIQIRFFSMFEKFYV